MTESKDIQKIFKMTLDQTLEGLQVLDFEWHYLYVNEAAATHGMNQRELLLGRRIMDVYENFENTDVFHLLRTVISDRIPRQMENLFEYPDGKKCWFEIFTEPHVQGILIRSIDITKRKSMESQQLHSQKIETIGTLVGGPMISIISSVS